MHNQKILLYLAVFWWVLMYQKTAQKTPKNGFPMRFLIGANEGIRTPDLLITKQEVKGLFCQILCGVCERPDLHVTCTLK